MKLSNNLLSALFLGLISFINAESVYRDDYNGKVYYIATTGKSCSSDDLVVCDNYYSKMIQAPGPWGGMPMHNYYLTDCVNGNNKQIAKINNNFDNPFDKCSLTQYNIQAGDCYSSPYNNKVVYRGKARKGNAPKKINNRCLVGGGWCPCGTNNNNNNNNNNNIGKN